MAAHAVWKYPIPFGRVTLDLPRGAVVVHVAAQNDMPTIWVRLDPGAPKVLRMYEVFATGEPVPGDAAYCGTAHTVGGALVWHIFEVFGD